ncbi:histone-lysine N-methyltransferase SETD1B-A-like [Carassius auratus]|uniref:Histone-lysine N-methyltransferase SETD1B-A-like n=1 Tax=Carassius auratus TaxID=7957 RepID=A0A6P6KCF4_CARAU|nr:histone-lysine N-methyltransferase SETD1B-A-like [Carassius auratus]XP_026105820.1 histone-lysine N-methyltransferase SETD1B-A-like [Carassius auratus]
MNSLRDFPRLSRCEMYEEMSVERNWTDTETRALLYIRQDEDINRQISGTVRDSLIYAEISRLLRAQGIHRTKRQVTTKLKTLKQKFLKIHAHHKNNGHGRVYWNYYDLCKSIWGSNRPADALTLDRNVKLEEPQSTSIDDARNERRSTDIEEVSVSHDEETDDMTDVVAQPVRKKAKKCSVTDSVRAQEPLHMQNQREYEERLRREAREEQKEDRTSLMAMWKEMMEFQGNLLKEFIHRPSLPSHPSYHRYALHNQVHSSFPSTSYMPPYDSPGAETENESAISHEEEEEEEEEEEKYVIPAEIAPVNRGNDSQSNTAETVSPPPTQSAGKSDLEMSVLRRQERVLQLQEEYYSLKINYLKHKMAKDP